MDLDEAASKFREFVSVIKALRTPVTGCPWDLEQDHHTLRPYVIEETYEVVDAIDRCNDSSLQEELGDLLLQVVLHAQVAEDRGAFSITDVIRGIADKMVRRHPHVFGSAQVSGSVEVLRNWEQIKASERQMDNDSSHAASLARLPESLPALLRAQRLGVKASRAGLDWTSFAEVLGKVQEDFARLQDEVSSAAQEGAAADAALPTVPQLPEDMRLRVEHGLGDLLFDLCQLGRWLGLSADDSLRACINRFVDRFQRMEQQAPRELLELNRDELKSAWRQAKQPAD